MGSFNISCGVSKISLHVGMPVAFIPLTPINTENNSPDIGAFIVSDSGPHYNYVPIGLPVFGKYGDYGKIDKIEHDVNTKCLEKYYKLKISTFIEIAAYPSQQVDRKLHTHVPTKLSGMFIHRKIYDHLSTKHKLDNSCETVAISKYLLTILGFKSESTDLCSTQAYTHPKLENLTIWLRNSSFEIIYKNNAVDVSHFNLKKLIEYLNINKIILPSEIVDIQKITYDELTYQCELIKHESYKEFNKIIDKVSNVNGVSYFNSDYFKLTNDYRHNNQLLTNIYGDVYKNNDFIKLFLAYKTFHGSLYNVNTLLQPTWNGIQFGDDIAMLELSCLTTKLLANEIYNV